MQAIDHIFGFCFCCLYYLSGSFWGDELFVWRLGKRSPPWGKNEYNTLWRGMPAPSTENTRTPQTQNTIKYVVGLTYWLCSLFCSLLLYLLCYPSRATATRRSGLCEVSSCGAWPPEEYVI